jgi:hypothetical protein
VLNALNGTAADATLSGDLQHALAAPQLTLDFVLAVIGLGGGQATKTHQRAGEHCYNC